MPFLFQSQQMAACSLQIHTLILCSYLLFVNFDGSLGAQEDFGKEKAAADAAQI